MGGPRIPEELITPTQQTVFPFPMLKPSARDRTGSPSEAQNSLAAFDALGSGDAINQLGYDHNHGTSGASDYLHTHTFLTEGMTTGAETQGQPHNIIQPSLVVNYIIKY
jgi:hypothetical protein